MHRKRIDGSSPHEPCFNDREKETATSSSMSKGISPPSPTVQRETGPVPLYLIPQALSGEIRQAGEALLEVNIRRTRGHHYLITLVSSSTEGESHA